jgi:hypothetical protein
MELNSGEGPLYLPKKAGISRAGTRRTRLRVVTLSTGGSGATFEAVLCNGTTSTRRSKEEPESARSITRRRKTDVQQ